MWDKALAYCRQAGAKAATRSAYREAVAYFEQALSALAHLPEHRDTLEQAIDLRLDYAQCAHRSLENWGDPRPPARGGDPCHGPRRSAPAGLGLRLYDRQWLRSMGDYERGLADGQRALAIATASGDFALEMMATFNLGIYYNILGDYRQAVDYHQEECRGPRRRVALRAPRRLPGPLSVTSRFWLVRSLAELGDFTEGLAQGAEAVRLAEAVEQPFTLSNAYLGIGFLYLRQGDLPQAIAVARQRPGTLPDHGRSAPAPVCCRGVGLCLCAVWPPRRGPATAGAGRRADCHPTLSQYPLWAAHLGEAYLLAGRLEEAHQLAEQCPGTCP